MLTIAVNVLSYHSVLLNLFSVATWVYGRFSLVPLVLSVPVGGREVPAVVLMPVCKLPPKVPCHLGTSNPSCALRTVALCLTFSLVVQRRLLVLLAFSFSSINDQCFPSLCDCSVPIPTVLCYSSYWKSYTNFSPFPLQPI